MCGVDTKNPTLCWRIRRLLGSPAMQTFDENPNPSRIIPGARKYPAKMNKIMSGLVDFLEAQIREGIFDRDYIPMADFSPEERSRQ